VRSPFRSSGPIIRTHEGEIRKIRSLLAPATTLVFVLSFAAPSTATVCTLNPPDNGRDLVPPCDSNAMQTDTAGDGLGDACDPCTNGSTMEDNPNHVLKGSILSDSAGRAKIKLKGHVTDAAFPWDI
jgi:hypothetical protein